MNSIMNRCFSLPNARDSPFLLQALHEKQSVVINSQANELIRRRGDLEVNLHLINELKVTIRF